MIVTLNLVVILAAMFIHQVITDEGVANTIELFLYTIIANSLKSILSLHAGESFTAPNVTGIEALSDSITFLWERDFEIDTYEIWYNFTIIECQSDIITEFWNVTINGSLWNFTLENGTDTLASTSSISSLKQVMGGIKPAFYLISLQKEQV